MSAFQTANDRFKRRAEGSFWPALVVATLLHAAAFAGSPVFALEAGAERDEGVRAIEIPPELRIPAPPEPIRPPAAPAIAEGPEVDPMQTIERTVFDDLERRPLEPPPPARDAGGVPFPTPMDVAPRLLNAREIQRALQAQYPPLLRDAGIGGVARVWFHIDARGRVVERRLHESSGYAELDRAALRVAERMEFAPALNRDRRVPVWVSMEIRFEAR